MEMFANVLVLVGAVTLVVALSPVSQLYRRLPSGSSRQSWVVLALLICFFVIGYVVYAYSFWGLAHQWNDMVVPAVFFFGAVFVLIVCNLALKTAEDIRRLCHLEHENITDPLMGIYNRRYLDRCLKQEWEKAKRYGLDFSVLMIDVDFFKEINDTYGHSVGDEVLQALGQMIKGSVRDFDRVFRYGGEELVVMLPYTDCDGAAVIAQRLCNWISDRSMAQRGDSSIFITVSIGVSCLCAKVEDVATMMSRADRALYRAKKKGRNRVEVAASSTLVSDQGAK